MSVQSDLFTLLSTDANVLALVGSEIYPQRRPQDAEDYCLVYQVVTGEGSLTLGGQAFDEQIVYQLVALAPTYGELIQLVAAVKLLSGSSQGDIQRIVIEDGPSGFDFTLNLFTQVLQIDISL